MYNWNLNKKSTTIATFIIAKPKVMFFKEKNIDNNKNQTLNNFAVLTGGKGEGCNWACGFVDAQNQSPLGIKSSVFP